MFSVAYVKDLAERAIATFAQAYVAAAVVLPTDFYNFQTVKLSAAAAALSVLKSLAARYKGDPATASLNG
jgi:hypothetical protein